MRNPTKPRRLLFAKNLFRLASLITALGLAIAAAVAQEPSVSRSAMEVGVFELRVVGPKGEEVPHAIVEIRSKIKSWEFLAGEQTRVATYGVFAKTDERGRLAFKMPADSMDYLNLSIEARGYGLFWAAWSFAQKSEKLPDSYTAHLDAGQSVGGILVDADGKPVANAQVHPSIEYKKREGDLSQLGSGKSYKTDAEGKWRVDTIPVQETTVRVQITHPDFMTTALTLPTSEYGLTLDQAPYRTNSLERGLTVAGTVVDPNNAPIAGATVRAEIQNNLLEADTDNTGRFVLKNCQPGTIELVVTAPKFAPDLQTISLRESMPDIHFQLEPGKTIRVRVTNKDGQPIAKSRIFFQDWRGESHARELGKMLTYTNDQGVWEWDSAPADAIVADICPVNGMQIPNQTLLGGAEEYHFIATPQLKVTGRVVDAESESPITNFRVVPGIRWPGREEPFWQIHDSFDGADGTFTYSDSRLDGKLLMRIEASGYAPLVSRDIAWDEEAVLLKYPLRKATDIRFRVLSPDGTPAQGASVVLAIAGSQVMLHNGDFTSQTYANRSFTDAEGRVTFRPQANAFKLFVVDASGYGEVTVQPDQSLLELQLDAWGQVAGKLRVGQELGVDADLVLYCESRAEDDGLPNAMHQYSQRVDKNGDFTFARVLPGPARIGRQVITHRSQSGYRTTFSHAVPILVTAGETLDLQLGGSGAAIKGTLTAPANFKEPVDWKFALVEIDEVIGQPPPIPFPADIAANDKGHWFQKWLITPPGIEWKAATDLYQDRVTNRKHFAGKIEDTGHFQIDDVPPGNYELTLVLHQSGTGTHFDRNTIVGILNFPFQLPPFSQNNPIVDLGELTFEPAGKK